MVGMGVLSVGVAITAFILLLQDGFLGYWLDLSPGELFAVGPLILAVVFGGLGYLGSRRVVPRLDRTDEVDHRQMLGSFRQQGAM